MTDRPRETTSTNHEQPTVTRSDRPSNDAETRQRLSLNLGCWRVLVGRRPHH